MAQAVNLNRMANFTQILTAAERGDLKATDQLLLVVYDELRQLAAAKLAKEKPGQTLEPTASVHEAYLRLIAGLDGTSLKWDGRGHFSPRPPRRCDAS